MDGGKTVKKFIIILSSILWFFSCGDDSESSVNGKAPYGNPTQSAVHDFNISLLEGVKKKVTGSIVGTQTISGREFFHYQAVSSDSVSDIYVTPYPLGNSKTVTFGKITTNSGFEITPIEPVEINLFPSTGENVDISMDFEAKLDGMNVKSVITLTGSYQLLSDNASVSTSMGTFNELLHYKGSGNVTGDILPGYLENVNLNAEVWYHPTVGVVMYEVAELGLGGDMSGTWDIGTEQGHSIVRKIGIINSENPNFELDTIQVSNELDADKNQHAKMLLEIRYVDDENAKTGPMPSSPAVNIEFGVTFGWFFGHELIESPVSIFHPEENGKGYKFFIAYVDQASKNSPGGEGISYHIKVNADTSITPDMRVTARILYKKLSDN